MGDVVSTADYDLDGLLDLFVTNGNTRFGTYPFYVGGKNQLFHNVTQNGNAWLEIDLIGTVSNRNGIGAKVYVAAGGITQMREANSGMHQYAQDNKRLHIGLGRNEVAETITVQWPSGRVSTLNNVLARKVISIQEPQ